MAAPKSILVTLDDLLDLRMMRDDGSGNWNRRFELKSEGGDLHLVIRIRMNSLDNYSIMLFLFDGAEHRNIVRYDSWGHHVSRLNPAPGITGEHRHMITESAQSMKLMTAHMRRCVANTRTTERPFGSL